MIVLRFLVVVIVLCTSMNLDGFSQSYHFLGIVYNKGNRGCSSAELVVDKELEITNGQSYSKVTQGFKTELKKNYPNSSNGTYYVAVVPVHRVAVVFKFKLKGGDCDSYSMSIKVAETPAMAEAAMRQGAKDFGWTDPVVVKTIDRRIKPK